MAFYVIKAPAPDIGAAAFDFARQKTMYGGKRVAAGDTLYMFSSETSGGRGLAARGVVLAAEPVPPVPGVARQTPRVTVRVRRDGLATRPLGRKDLKAFDAWGDGRPQTELNFKLYRQATDKIVGISAEAAAFLEGHFTA